MSAPATTTDARPRAMKIAVYGAGGVGGYYGAVLARAGHEVALIARGAHLAAIQRSGLRVRSPDDDFVARPALATSDPAEAGPVDAVIVTVKSLDLPQAAERARPLLGEDTFVLPLLNGVDAHEVLAVAVGRRRVGKGATRIIGHVSAPGEISVGKLQPHVAMAEWDGQASARTHALVSALRAAGVEAEVPPDIDAALWQKFVLVCPMGGLCAACRQPVGVVRSTPESRELLRRAMEEIVALAVARGVGLSDEAVTEGMAFADSVPANAVPSLHRDIAAGWPSELDAWSGAVVRMASEAGVPTPVHHFLHAVLRPGEEAARRRFHGNRREV